MTILGAVWVATALVAVGGAPADISGHLPDLPKTVSSDLLGEVDLRSSLFGFAAGFVVAWVLAMLLRAAKFAVKLAVIGVVMTVAGGGYFAEMRRRAGLGTGDVFTSPVKILDDAKGAAEKLKLHMDSTKSTLDEIEKDDLKPKKK